MIPYPQINPDLITIGPIHVRWYGVMYVLGFLGAYVFIQRQERSRQIGLTGVVVQDLVFYLAIGVIVGARLGYILFYQYHAYLFYLENPLEIIATWRGGMSFNGGLVGSCLPLSFSAGEGGSPSGWWPTAPWSRSPLGWAWDGSAISSMPNYWGVSPTCPWAMVFREEVPCLVTLPSSTRH